MHTQQIIYVFQNSAFQNFQGAGAQFFRWLEYCFKTSLFYYSYCQRFFRRCQQHGTVGIVTAGMTEFFLSVDDMGQSVHIRPDTEYRARHTAVIFSYKTCSPGKVPGYLKAGFCQFLCQIRRGFYFFETRFRNRMEILIMIQYFGHKFIPPCKRLLQTQS